MNEMEQIPEGWDRVDPRDDRLENAADRFGARRHRHYPRDDHRHRIRWVISRYLSDVTLSINSLYMISDN